ncbi:MAG: hypothetical protein QM493_07790 [Sulfurovum sp.]
MKFLVTKDSKLSPLLRYLIVGVLFAMILYLLLDILLHGYLLGFDINSIKATLFGDEENFIEPILFDTLLMQIHINLFFSLIAIMIISSLYIRFYNSYKRTKIFVHLMLFLGFLSPLLLLITFLYLPWLLLGFLSIFFTLHILTSIISILILKKLIFR